MINKQDFKKIRDKMSKYDKGRETLIKKARDVLKLSKQLIYTIHRKDMKGAAELVTEIKKEKAELDKIASVDKELFHEGSYSQAMQEYVEAFAYYGFIKNKKIPSFSSLKVAGKDYLMGICDLSGELARKAVTIAHKNPKEVKKIKDLVEDIFGEFLKFNLRNSELRKKSDSIKWNLKKLEEVTYDIGKRK
jgi:translin|tara:strand:- start:654 stop:1226 length:573 start_codon:yes stop_codon:yes gene_type:complete